MGEIYKVKLIHISDLHLGKRLHEASLIEDQQYILRRILDVIDVEAPTGVMIAGDIYDKSVPSAEAVALFDSFLVQLAKRRLEVFIISGNHDSAERIAFGSKIMDSVGIHLSPVYDGSVKATTLKDGYGDVDVYMLPFVKPSHVRRFYEDEDINSYTDAVRVAVEKMNVDEKKRNVLITHQFVTGASRSESEESVGGTDNVDAAVFERFDYVALGHLHGAQSCLRETIRYCGTPLKYSFSEANDTKSVTVVELGAKGEAPVIRTVQLQPIRDLRRVRGTFDELIGNANARTDDYVQITLTDEDDIPNAMSRLQTVYKNALELRYDNTRTRANASVFVAGDTERKTPFELFSEFFYERNKSHMSDEQKDYMRQLIEKIEGDEE